MSYSPVLASVTSSASTTTFNAPAKLPANQTIANATPIGDLEQEGDVITVSDQGSTDGTQTYNFTLDKSANTYLQLSFSNFVDKLTTHYQLFDSQNNLIADNQGTAEQQAAFSQLTSSGYSPGAGNYSLQVTPVGGEGSPQIALSALPQQGTSLAVNSTLTSGDNNQDYSFSLGNSNNIKLNLNANSGVRVQLFNSDGSIVADSRGNAFQINNYYQLTSGTGLTAATGDYVVQVSYTNPSKDPSTPSPNIKYNLQLFSGSTYSVVDTTNATPAVTDNSAAGSVTSTSNAQAFGQQAYHTLNETAQTAVSIGYLTQNKTSLKVTSQLTAVDNTDYYNFVLQGGSKNIKLALNNLTNKADTSGSQVHLQLLDSSGTQVIADNQGTAAQKTAFAQLTSSTGLTGNPGSYVIKATYAAGAQKSQALTYSFQVYSGTSYSAQYNTTASPQTYENALLSGNIAGGYSPAAAAATYLNNLSQGTDIDIMSAIQSTLA